MKIVGSIGIASVVVMGTGVARAGGHTDDTAQPAVGWWKQGVAACPKGGRLDGGPPPQTHAMCRRSDMVAEGPEAFWDDKGHLISIGENKDGRRQGLFTAFYPDGKKHREGSYRAGNQHGTWTTWWPDGKVFLVEHFVDGRADGEQVATAEDGHVIDRWTLKMGTGRMKAFTDDGKLENETDYVDGRASGASVSYWPNGKVQEKMTFVDCDADGLAESWNETGQLHQRGTYARGNQVGDWSDFDDHGAQTRLTRRDGKGDEQWELLYDGGKPLVPVPGATACDDKEGMARAAGISGGRRGGEPECLERMRHFTGLAVVGSFAYDAGCMDPQWIVDCKKGSAPDSKAVLARAGWPRAKGAQREELAMAYVNEVAMLWSGSMLDEPDPRKTVSGGDGSVTVTAWTAAPAGMRPDPTITMIEWKFTSDGAVSQRTVKTGTRK